MAEPTLPVAFDWNTRPRLVPTRPPRIVLGSCPGWPPVLPAAPVTAPLALPLKISPLLKPTNPPPRPFEPVWTAPVAETELATNMSPTVPLLKPTSPPALMLWQSGLQLVVPTAPVAPRCSAAKSPARRAGRAAPGAAPAIARARGPAARCWEPIAQAQPLSRRASPARPAGHKPPCPGGRERPGRTSRRWEDANSLVTDPTALLVTRPRQGLSVRSA